jgi:NadR type nicotinamide-nucleotide adenylyltransferase
MSTGVVIGKFWPYSLGHDALVRWAKPQVDKLSIIVCDNPNQLPSADVRASWIQSLHPDADVIITPDDIPNESEPWAKRTVEILGRSPDFVFTSEDYGPVYAEFMDSEHRMFDRNRDMFPISGTALRSDLVANWDYLVGPVKAHYAKRIVVLGVDSSGTTTLANDLAHKYGTICVPEYGRMLWEYKRDVLGDPGDWATSDFEQVAYMQNAMEEECAAQSRNGLLICDTDSLATHVWHKRYLGYYSAAVMEIVKSKKRVDLYILTRPEFGFIQDGTREENEGSRMAMHRWFLNVIDRFGVPCISVHGNYQQRLEKSVRAIDPIVQFPVFER